MKRGERWGREKRGERGLNKRVLHVHVEIHTYLSTLKLTTMKKLKPASRTEYTISVTKQPKKKTKNCFTLKRNTLKKQIISKPYQKIYLKKTRCNAAGSPTC